MNLYSVFYEQVQLREAGVYANSKEEAIQLFNNGDYEEDVSRENLDRAIKSVDCVMGDV